jgi:transposase-like protein
MGRLARNLIGVSVKECARQLGVSDTAIHKAIRAERCQKHPDGSVDVEAVRLGMALTADPLRGGSRQAGVFGEASTGSAVSLPGELPFTAPEAAPAADSGRGHRPLLDARTLTEQARAEREQIELAKLKGSVAEIAPITRAVHDAMVAARSELLSLPDRLTPLVTPEQDPAKVYGLIETEVQRVCQTLQDKLAQMARTHAMQVAS